MAKLLTSSLLTEKYIKYFSFLVETFQSCVEYFSLFVVNVKTVKEIWIERVLFIIISQDNNNEVSIAVFTGV